MRNALATCSWATLVSAHGDGLLIDADANHRGELVTIAERFGGLRELVEERRSLEDVFRDLIGA
jgi:hypothetical protein